MVYEWYRWVWPNSTSHKRHISISTGQCWYEAGIILCMGSANERRRYIVTSHLNGWAHTQNIWSPWVVARLKARSHSALRLDHGQNPSKSGLPWSRRCCSRWCRVYDELQSIYRRGRTRQKIGTASDAAKSFEQLKILVRGQSRVAHVVKTCNTRATHVKHADNPCSGSD